MSEIHTKKYLEENPEAATESTSVPTPSVTTESSSFFSGMLFRLIIALIVIIGVGGYVFFQAQKVFIDNPSKAQLVIKINGKEYTIEPNSSITASIGFGKHKVEVLDDEEFGGEFERNIEWNFDTLLKLKDMALGQYDVVNPLLYPYFLDYMIYGQGTNSIPPKIMADLYLPISWDYGLDEKYPESVSISRRSSAKSITKKKIFRFSDFAKEYEYSEDELLKEIYGNIDNEENETQQ